SQISIGQIIGRPQPANIVGAKFAYVEFPGASEVFLGLPVLAESAIGHAHGVLDVGFDDWLSIKLVRNCIACAVKERPHFKMGIGARSWARLFVGARLSKQIILQEIIYGLSDSRLFISALFFGYRPIAFALG